MNRAHPEVIAPPYWSQRPIRAGRTRFRIVALSDFMLRYRFRKPTIVEPMQVCILGFAGIG